MAFVVFAYSASLCFGVFALVPQAFGQQDEALDPIDVGFFGADGMMFGSDGASDTSTSSVQARSSSFFSRRFVMIPPTCGFRFVVVR